MAKRTATAVHLSDRTMSALRPGDAVSGRINQIVDRYLQIIDRTRAYVRDQFDAEEWLDVLNAYILVRALESDVLRLSQLLVGEIDDLRVSELVGDLECAETAVLFELLEAELAARHEQS